MHTSGVLTQVVITCCTKLTQIEVKVYNHNGKSSCKPMIIHVFNTQFH